MSMRPRTGGHTGVGSRIFLIEAMVGMIVLTIVLTLIGAIPAAYGLTAQDSVRVQAVSAGQEYLDMIRQYVKASGIDTGLPPPAAVPTDGGNGMTSGTHLPSEGDFAMTPSCSSRSLFSFECSVDVAWSVTTPA